MPRVKQAHRTSRTKVIHVRATPEQYEAWLRASQAERRTLSSWVQVKLDDAAEGSSK